MRHQERPSSYRIREDFAFQIGTFTPPNGLNQVRQNPNFDAPGYRVLETGYKRLLPSLANVVVNGRPTGTAVLIDPSGLYLTSKAMLSEGEVELDFSNGHVGHASLLSQDGCTQMVLLRADYVPNGATTVNPVTLTPAGTSLMVILPSGAVSARVISDTKLGLVEPSNRIMPLSEIRLELPQSAIGGAPVFTSDGGFVGLLSGSLVHTELQKTVQTFPNSNPNQPFRFSGGNQGGAFGGAGGGGGAIVGGGGRILNSAAIGPADLTVAYLPGPDVVRLVMDGFESNTHVVDHPTLGVFCGDAPGGLGALIHEVIADSPASKIGLRERDMIVEIGGHLIRDKNDFARVMFKCRAGNKVTVKFYRSGKLVTRDVSLGSSYD